MCEAVIKRGLPSGLYVRAHFNDPAKVVWPQTPTDLKFYGPRKLKGSYPDYKKAAEQGFAPAQARLALFYLPKFQEAVRHRLPGYPGLPQPDPVIARDWAAKAAAQGNITGMTYYGLMLLRGIGGGQDLQKGSDVLHRAAMNGSRPAAETISFMYLHGVGRKVDLHQAFVWMIVSQTAYFGIGSPTDEPLFSDYFNVAQDINEPFLALDGGLPIRFFSAANPIQRHLDLAARKRGFEGALTIRHAIEKNFLQRRQVEPAAITSLEPHVLAASFDGFTNQAGLPKGVKATDD